MPEEYSPWAQAAANTAQSAGGAIMGLALGGIENKRQIKQQRKLNELNLQQHKAFTDFNSKKQLEIWEATNYPAQIAQMKKAGINPALLYDSGGMSGSTGLSAGNAGNSQAARGTEGIQGMGMGLQSGMMLAQIKLMEAQTEKTKAEATKTAGVDTDLAKSQVSLNSVEQQLKQMEAEVKGRTIEDAIDIITANASMATYEALREQRFNKIDEATMEANIQGIQTRAIGALLDNATKSKGLEVADAQIQKWAAEIAQGWQSLELQDVNQQIHKWVEENKANNPGLGQVVGKLFNNALEEIRNATKPKYRGYKIPIKK